MAVFEKLTAFGFSPDGRNTHRYLLLGDTRKPVVVLLSGYTQSHSSLAAFSERLQKHYCVIIPELPGWEGTASTPMTVREYTAYMKALVDFLGLKSISVVAHCVGNAVAVDFAELYPSRIKELFLVSVPHLEGLVATPAFVRNKLLGKVKQHLGKQSKHNSLVLEKHWESYTRFSFHRISHLPISIHLIHGGNDALVRPDKVKVLKGKSSRVTFDVLLGAGHIPSNDRPDALAAVILGYAHPTRRS